MTVAFLLSLAISLLPSADRSATNCRPPPVALLSGSETTPAVSGIQIVNIRQGEITCSMAFGVAQQSGTAGEALISTDHKVRVASISKLAVGMAIMKLAEDGKLDLEADVSHALGFPLRNPAFPQTVITLSQLMSHTSSVRDGSVYWLPSGGKVEDFFSPGSENYEDGAHFTSDLEEAPGEYFTYANLNYGLLAAVIERATDERFDLAMQRLVLQPLGMTGASFNPCTVVSSGYPLATLYRKGDGGVTWEPEGPWRAQVDGDDLICAVGLPAVPRADISGSLPHDADATAITPTSFSPQGGLRASAEDVARLLLALRPEKNSLLKPSSASEMLTPQWQVNDAGTNGATTEFEFETSDFVGLMTAWGRSVHLIDLADWGFGETAPQMVGHLGEAYGLLGVALIDPETGNGLVALVTGTADDPAKHPSGVSPLYRVEEEIVRWWLSENHP